CYSLLLHFVFPPVIPVKQNLIFMIRRRGDQLDPYTFFRWRSDHYRDRNPAISNGEGLHMTAMVKEEGGIVEVSTSRFASWDCLGSVLESPSYGPIDQTMSLSLDSKGAAL